MSLGVMSCSVTNNNSNGLVNGKPSIFMYDGPVEVMNADGSKNNSIVKNAGLDGVLLPEDNLKFWELMEVDCTTDFVVVFYLHGIRSCGGMWSKEQSIKEDKRLRKKISKYGNSELRYLHFGDSELARYKASANYQKDTNGEINQMFFGGFANCSSYLTVRKDGQYIGWFGELALKDIPGMVNYNMAK